MPEAHDLFPGGQRDPDTGLRIVRARVSLNEFHCGFIGAAVKRAPQRTYRAGDGRMKVRQGCGDNARGKCRRVEFVLGVEDQRYIHGTLAQITWRGAVQEVQEVTGNAVVVGFDFDARAVIRIAVPVEQHRWKRGQQPVRDFALAGKIAFRLQVAQNRAAST